MTDIHCHLIYGIDDGSRSVEESIEVLTDLYNYGYRNIILTPHYIKDSSYCNKANDNYKRMKVLQRIIDQNGLNMRLFLGNEIYMDDEIYELLKSGEIYSLNGTEYLLIELPMDGEYPDYKEVFKDLMNKGCKIVLAHPERYLAFQKDFNIIYDLEKIGVFFQSNIESLIGRYGEGAKVMIKRLLKEKKIAFLATDIHHKKHNYSDYDKAKSEALKYISESEYETLVKTNPSKLIC